MIEVIPFQPRHLSMIELQDEQLESEVDAAKYRDIIGVMGPARTGMEDGRVVYCAGIIEGDESRIVWTMLSDCGPERFRVVHKQISSLINEFIDHRGLVSFVREGYEKGRRWMRLLGFNDTGILQSCDGVVHRRYFLCRTQ